MTGVQTCALPILGVSFGYAGEGELSVAGADMVADTMEQLERILLGDELLEKNEH